MEYVIIAIAFIIILYLYYLNTPVAKGKSLENAIHRYLQTYATEHGSHAFKDVMFKDDVYTSQIDNILITRKAIYVIEAKNYNGHIFGSKHNEYWTMTVKHVNTKHSRSGKTYKKTHISKHKFYNPVKQNQTHIHKLIKALKIDSHIPIFNVIVFGHKAYLSDVEQHEDYAVINYQYLARYIRTKEASLMDAISHDQIASLVDDVIVSNIIDKNARKKHVLDIRRKYK